MGKKGCSSGCGNICATASTQEITTVADGRFFKSKDMKTLSADGVSAKTVKIKNASSGKLQEEVWHLSHSQLAKIIARHPVQTFVQGAVLFYQQNRNRTNGAGTRRKERMSNYEIHFCTGK